MVSVFFVRIYGTTHFSHSNQNKLGHQTLFSRTQNTCQSISFLVSEKDEIESSSDEYAT